ncbi:MAG: hydrogenase maturation nickel metallochaperone HypA [Aigarchaeota archaeon]|nr:hydrogenase maturation nickel metallochaperone HypA [Candidatus Pelearchaeum maunauluense]
MERHRFVCSECGAEYYLQAWKAVCPNCQSEYTLTLVETPREGRKIFTAREYGALLIIGYTLLSFFLPSTPTLINLITSLMPIPEVAIYFLFLLLALFLFLGTTGGVWAAMVIGVIGAAYGAASIPVNGLTATIPTALASLWFVGALLFHRHSQAIRAHQEKMEDARNMPEYSGWGSEKSREQR